MTRPVVPELLEQFGRDAATVGRAALEGTLNTVTTRRRSRTGWPRSPLRRSSSAAAATRCSGPTPCALPSLPRSPERASRWSTAATRCRSRHRRARGADRGLPRRPGLRIPSTRPVRRRATTRRPQSRRPWSGKLDIADVGDGGAVGRRTRCHDREGRCPSASPGQAGSRKSGSPVIAHQRSRATDRRADLEPCAHGRGWPRVLI